MYKSILKQIIHRLTYKPYQHFSIIGASNRAYGIDAARYEPDFNPDNALPGLIDFGIIKATEGVSWKDSAFETLSTQVAKLAVDGAYHYLRSGYTGVDQANYFISTLGTKQFDILAIDFERINNVISDGFVRTLYDCLVKVTQLRPNAKVMLYSNVDLYDSVIYPAAIRLWGRDMFLEWDLWLAQYPYIVNLDGQPSLPIHRKDWTIWQFSDAGLPAEHGTSSYIDRNLFNGTREQLLAWANKTPTIPGEPMLEDLYFKVTATSLNIRSSAENLGTANDLGNFNLQTNDVIHAIEVVQNGIVTYHQIEKIWRNGVILTPLVISPTGKYWSAEKSGTEIWMVPTTNPTPPPVISPVMFASMDFDLVNKTMTITRRREDGTSDVLRDPIT